LSGDVSPNRSLKARDKERDRGDGEPGVGKMEV